MHIFVQSLASRFANKTRYISSFGLKKPELLGTGVQKFGKWYLILDQFCCPLTEKTKPYNNDNNKKKCDQLTQFLCKYS